MVALTLHRDDYGPPQKVLRVEEVAVPQLGPADANRVLISILATGPNFNTNFAALGLPIPVFGRGDAARRKVPMSPEDLLEAAILVYLGGLGLGGEQGASSAS